MVDQVRFQRLEDKVDKLDDKVDHVKVDLTELKADIKIHMHTVEKHISQDQKIINIIAPVMEKLPDMVQMIEDYRFERGLKERKMATIKTWSARLALVSTVIGIIVTVSKFL